MAKLYKVKRREGEITVRVLHEGKIIDGKYVPAGWLEVVEGVNGEQYRIDPDTFLIGYNPSPELMRELEETNGWKL